MKYQELNSSEVKNIKGIKKYKIINYSGTKPELYIYTKSGAYRVSNVNFDNIPDFNVFYSKEDDIYDFTQGHYLDDEYTVKGFLVSKVPGIYLISK